VPCTTNSRVDDGIRSPSSRASTAPVRPPHRPVHGQPAVSRPGHPLNDQPAQCFSVRIGDARRPAPRWRRRPRRNADCSTAKAVLDAAHLDAATQPAPQRGSDQHHPDVGQLPHRDASSLRTLPPGRTSTHARGFTRLRASPTSVRRWRDVGRAIACWNRLNRGSRAGVLAQVELVDVHRVHGDVVAMARRGRRRRRAT